MTKAEKNRIAKALSAPNVRVSEPCPITGIERVRSVIVGGKNFGEGTAYPQWDGSVVILFDSGVKARLSGLVSTE